MKKIKTVGFYRIKFENWRFYFLRNTLLESKTKHTVEATGCRLKLHILPYSIRLPKKLENFTDGEGEPVFPYKSHGSSSLTWRLSPPFLLKCPMSLNIWTLSLRSEKLSFSCGAYHAGCVFSMHVAKLVFHGQQRILGATGITNSVTWHA